MSDEPAYTPKVEYQCDGSTTHYQGCKCHEARRNEEIRSLAERVNQQSQLINLLKDAVARARGLLADDWFENWEAAHDVLHEAVQGGDRLAPGSDWYREAEENSQKALSTAQVSTMSNEEWVRQHLKIELDDLHRVICPNCRALLGEETSNDSLVKQMWDADQKVYRAQETQLKETRRLLDWIASACGTPDAAEGCRNILARIREFKSRE